MTLEQAQAFVDSLDAAPLQWKAFCVLAIYSGLRRGELLGLEWPDIDFDNRIITVCRESQYNPTDGLYTDTPKTASSRRTLKLPQVVFDVLRAYRADQNATRLSLGDQWHDSGRLFTGEDGKPMVYFFNTCRDAIRTLPLLTYSDTDPEDLDTAEEDHFADSFRYFCMSRPIRPVSKKDAPSPADDPLDLNKTKKYRSFSY